MNRTHTFLGAFALALAVSPAFASNWYGVPDMEQSILNVHASGFVGTGFSSGKVERGTGDTYGSILLDVKAGDIRPSAGPEKGQGDTYGSVLHDL